MEKIDFVITWVDGNDQEWLDLKRKYKVDDGNDASKARYRDFETLKYCIRSIEKYAPWYNKIYLVTYGHLPSWLNIDNEKLVIVKHEDYIPKEYLPTFNSCTIELNLHRIKDLSSNFIYLNDDSVFINEVKPEDFFKKGLPCDSAVLNAIIPYGKDNFQHRLVNLSNVINRNFDLKKSIKKDLFKWVNFKYHKDLLRSLFLLPWGKISCLKVYHIHNCLRKKTMEELWEKESKVMHISCKDKFRSFYGVNPWIFEWWDIMSGEFYPRSSYFGTMYEMNDDISDLSKLLYSKKYKELCLNDSTSIKDFERVKKDMIEMLNKKFPDKSSFEE